MFSQIVLHGFVSEAEGENFKNPFMMFINHLLYVPEKKICRMFKKVSCCESLNTSFFLVLLSPLTLSDKL